MDVKLYQPLHQLDLDDPSSRLLGVILRRQAETIPGAVYVLEQDRSFTYGRANELASGYAAGLAALGVGRGDPVAFLMRPCSEFVFATYGAMKLGAVWIPTNVDYKGRWLREALEDSHARVLMVDADLVERVVEVADGLPIEHVVVRGNTEACAALAAVVHPLDSLLEHGMAEPDQGAIHYGDTAAVLWTSGTTGRSKGVMQSHNAWVRGAVSGARTSGVRDADLMYSCLPMYNSAAWVTAVHRALVCGLPFALDSEFSAKGFWERCRHYGATQTFTLGAMHMYLWQAPERDDDADNPVRHASMIPLPDALIAPIKRRFGIDTIDQGYGQSEILGLVHRVDDGTEWKPGCLGVALPGVEVALLDDDDREVGPGEIGEFSARPTEPYVLFNGYYNNPEATLRAFSNLWYHTGDLGRRDEDGDYFFVDRKADFIRHKGRNVSSFAVEAAVSAHEAVAEVAAHGVKTAELESEAELKVAVVLKPGHPVTAEELARFINDTAPYFFVPRYIEFLEELPHTPTGRVQKYKLRERGVTATTWDRESSGFVLER
ncbi:MAG: AMP-binding protein [Myxococcales bacterium]|nr:MAG: AMP-binding protein [Myxococcales bacterium]